QGHLRAAPRPGRRRARSLHRSARLPPPAEDRGGVRGRGRDPDGAWDRLRAGGGGAMKRLFLQLWAKLFCSLLAAAIVVVLVVLPRMKQQVGSNLVRVMTPALRAVSEAVAQEPTRGGDLPGVLARVSDRFAVTVTAIARADVRDLNAAQLASLDRGQVVVSI